MKLYPVVSSSLGLMLLVFLMVSPAQMLSAFIEDALNAEQVAWAVQSVDNFIESNLQLLAKRNDITDTMNRITSRFQQMQHYVTHQDKLENSTLLTLQNGPSLPNAYSVNHLMDRLHLTMFGSDDYASKSA
ncbi:hypothetical protein EVAR_101542_1 [Eumeta japonica]|uniref:Uncharacterized protein n=1 Tax=Eumeta variegata TaxID=151549 RepID=A0A4C1SS43_EUMVA|nr:hypothetical protein EVAR_101542_1 [Eumeta japonica]